MKILHVCETINGGIATYLNTFHTICGDWTDNVFVVPSGDANQVIAGATVFPYVRKGRGLRGLLNLIRTSAKVAKQQKPDFIFFHSSFAVFVAPIFRLLRVRGIYVYCPHGWGRLGYAERPIAGRLVSCVEGTLAGVPDVVLNISKNDRDLALRLGYRGDHRVVENALPDTSGTTGESPINLGEERVNLLFVGRFARAKGLDILLEAFESAALNNPALCLHVVGAVEGGAAGSTFDRRGVTFHGWVPYADIAAYYSNADLVVVPSRWEGLPMALIEGLRAGTPVLVADTSGLGELIEEGVSGLVAPANASGIAEVLSGVTRRQLSRMRGGARAQYEARYGSERFGNDMREFFEYCGKAK
jgi:glycosyltransferase involved in cell wall biosynthesis